MTLAELQNSSHYLKRLSTELQTQVGNGICRNRWKGSLVSVNHKTVLRSMKLNPLSPQVQLMRIPLHTYCLVHLTPAFRVQCIQLRIPNPMFVFYFSALYNGFPPCLSGADKSHNHNIERASPVLLNTLKHCGDREMVLCACVHIMWQRRLTWAPPRTLVSQCLALERVVLQRNETFTTKLYTST